MNALPAPGAIDVNSLTAEELDPAAMAQLAWASPILAPGSAKAAAYDLHDGPAQSLTWCRDMLRMLERRYDAPEIGEIRDVVEGTLAEIRETIGRLCGERVRTARPLAEQLHDEIDAFVRRQAAVGRPIDVCLELPSPMPLLPDAISETAFRIVQESLTNAARHGHAGVVSITLAHGGDGLRIAVEDDGCGFDSRRPPDETARRCMGLESMGTRARGVGGGVDVSSASSGTVVHAVLPVGPSLALAR